MSSEPTGRRERRAEEDYVVFTRTFRAPIEDVWAAVTEPARLERWVGTWSGEPRSGQVQFRMTAEAEDAPEETQRIEVCDPPRRLVTRSTTPDSEDGPEVDWLLDLELSESDGVTTLTFAQAMPSAEMAASVGPGWDYYLDRLVAAETGGDVEAIDFDSYYPLHAEHYRAMFAG